MDDYSARMARQQFEQADQEALVAGRMLGNADEELGGARRKIGDLVEETMQARGGLQRAAGGIHEAADGIRRATDSLGETIVNLSGVTQRVGVASDAVATAESQARRALESDELTPELRAALAGVLGAVSSIGQALQSVGSPLAEMEQILLLGEQTLGDTRLQVVRAADGLEDSAVAVGTVGLRIEDSGQSLSAAQLRLAEAVAGTRGGRQHIQQAAEDAQRGGMTLN